jgi:hypothetical protein
MADGITPRCSCDRCRMHGLMGPVVLITIGAIFLVTEYTALNLSQLWPVLLVVIGIVMLVQSFASRAGHTGS